MFAQQSRGDFLHIERIAQWSERRVELQEERQSIIVRTQRRDATGLLGG
jgi:hypothetical protein